MKKTIIHCLLLFLFVGTTIPGLNAQNRYEETIPYESVDGHIVIKAKVKGKEYKFLLISGSSSSAAIVKNTAVEMGVNLSDGNSGTLEGLGIGEILFIPSKAVKIIENEDLVKAGIVGLIDIGTFAGNVITIDSKEQSIIITTPYKPEYVQLKNRMDIKPTNKVSLIIDNKPVSVSLDLNGDYMLLLNTKDYNSIKTGLKNEKSGVSFNIPTAYGKEAVSGTQATLPLLMFAKKELADQIIYTSADVEVSSVGAKILDYGLLSIDYSKRKLYFEPYETLKRPVKTNVKSANLKKEGEIIYLTRPAFFHNVFNFRENKEWKYQGDKPAIIDYWAEWCGPCKKLNPILEELASEYKDKVLFYKVNIEDEKEIAAYFKITSIPLLMYIPMEGEPIVVPGLRSKAQIKQMIEESLLKNK